MRHPDEGTGQTPGPLPSDGHLDEGAIHAWLDGALGETESARVERHVASCDACAAMAAEARGLVAAASRILTRLDDVPAQVIPEGAESGASPTSRQAILTREAAREGARRRRRWMPAAWAVSAAAAAVLMAVLVTGDDAERVLEQSTSPASARDAAPVPATVESAPPVESIRAVPRQARPGSRTEQAPAVGRAAVGQAAAPQRVEAFGAGARRVAGAEVPSAARPSVDRAAADSVVADTGIPNLGVANTAIGGAFAGSVTVGAVSADSAAAVFQLAETSVSTDSLTRARLARRIGFGRRILSGAPLVESTIVTTANELERRSVYELEDGARVTLVEGPSAVSLEAVVVTSADAESAAQASKARQERERRQAPAAAAAPAPRAESASPTADSLRALDTIGGERIVVRPDGVVRLEWRDDGTVLALEGELPIDRLRALRARVQR